MNNFSKNTDNSFKTNADKERRDVTNRNNRSFLGFGAVLRPLHTELETNKLQIRMSLGPWGLEQTHQCKGNPMLLIKQVNVKPSEWIQTPLHQKIILHYNTANTIDDTESQQCHHSPFSCGKVVKLYCCCCFQRLSFACMSLRHFLPNVNKAGTNFLYRKQLISGKGI